MAVNEVHAVVVADAPPAPPAVVRDLDLVARVGAIDTAASSAATRPATIAADDTLAGAAQALAREGHSHLVVLAPGEGNAVGILSSLDIAAALAARSGRAMRTIRPRMARPLISTSRLDQVAVGRAMHPGVFACSPDAPLAEVAAMMVDRRVHSVAVAGAPASASWKFVTDMSVVRAAAQDSEVRAADLVGEAVWISRDAMLNEAVDLMVSKETSHLLVAGDHEPAGVLSTLDVIDVLAIGG
jgi:CBS domain-containing protein